MKILFNRKNLLSSFALALFASQAQSASQVTSPDGNLTATISLNEKGAPHYSVSYKGQPLLTESPLGLSLKDAPALDQGFALTSAKTSTNDTTWTPFAGENNTVRDHYNQLSIGLSQRETAQKLNLTFRAFDEGLAFAYEIPKQDQFTDFTITKELTEFHFLTDHFCWDTKDPQEHYQRIPLSKIDKGCKRPLVVEVSGGPYLAIGEARMVDYSRFSFQNASAPHSLALKLDSVVTATAPYSTPWRYLMIGDTPGQLIENNHLVPNLNDPCAIADPSWIRPGKAIRSELSTKDCLATIDWIKKMNATYLLIDAGWYGNEMKNESDATTVTVDPNRECGPFDLQKIIDYGKKHDVGVILYVNRRALEKQLDDLLPLFQEWGVAGIKFGFVNTGPQEWTKWLHESVQKCAEYEIVVDIHDDYRPTGWSRTYPNLLTQEGVRGNEEMPDAENNLILPFTRYLCGPADYTVCYYSGRLQTTRAHQLAASIVYFSPLQLLFWYDGPDKYKGEPELDIFKHVHTTWDETKIVQGQIGQYITAARRKDEQWFIGSMNAGERRQLEIPLTFLKPGVTYTASINSDSSPEGEVRTKVKHETQTVTSQTVLSADMADNGGQAILLTPLH
ncbi:MAG: glycoside hydrolase family 97 N-terminal domain-containing protein [Roseibacillus sp.]